jgi:4-azaleucine resistance transporter AzlC
LTEFLAGARDELPILLGVIPFGMIYGVLAVAAGLPASTAQAMSVVIFAGSAQFMVVQLFGNGAPLAVIAATAVVVNLRHLLYSASISSHVRSLPPLWKGLLAYLLTDEAYAVAITHYDRAGDHGMRHWYFLGAGLILWSVWQASTAAGIFLGAQVPASWSLDFTLALTFIALVVPSLKNRAELMAALTAGVVSVLAVGLPYKLGLLLAALVGIFVGVGMEERWRRSG